MRIIPITGVIGWDVTEQGISDELAAANGGPVEFHFSSPGGLVGAGLGIGAQIRNYPGETTAVMTGYAMSMASYLPQCCDKRVAMDDAVFMIHNARGMTWGDHNDVLKYGTYLKGLSGVIAKRLSKCSGNDLAAVAEWMDNETFFFGEEIVSAGFADEIRQTQKDKDKDTSVATATAAYEQAVALMTKEATAVREDLNKAMAMNLSDELPIIVKPPAAAGTKQEEVQQMNLTELLAANPAAKVEHDALIAQARTEGEKAGSAAMAAKIEKVTPFLASASYPPTVGALAIKVLKGEESEATLTTVVSTLDAVREDAATKAAAAATVAAGETHGEQHPPVDATVDVKDDAGLDAAVARIKGGV